MQQALRVKGRHAGMDFSAPISITRSLVLAIPQWTLIASADRNRLSLHSLATLTLIETHSLPAPPVHLSCSPEPPFVLAAASSDAITLIALKNEDAGRNSTAVTISLSQWPVMSVALTQTTVVAFHAYGLGASIFPLRGHRAGPIVPVFLPHVLSPRSVPPPDTLPCSAALSPCKQFLATALKLPNGSPAVQIAALPRGDILAVASGSVALGGKIADVAGIFWLSKPHDSLFVWGQPADGPDAICLLGLDCRLLQEGMPGRTAEHVADNAAAGLISAAGNLPIRAVTPSPRSKRRSRRRRSSLASPQASRPSDGAADDEGLKDTYRDLGVKMASAVQGGSIVAIGGYEGTVHVVNTLTWTLVASWELDHPAIDQNYPPVVYIEREKLISAAESEIRRSTANSSDGRATARQFVTRATHFEAVDCNGHIALPKRKQFGVGAPGVDTLLQNGVGMVECSADGHWLALRSDRSPCVVYVADILYARLASVLVMKADVRCLSWSTSAGSEVDNPRLAIATDGQNVSFWSENGAAVVRVPDVHNQATPQHIAGREGRSKPLQSLLRCSSQSFFVRRVAWNGDGTLLALDTGTAGSFSVIYMQQQAAAQC
jgi:hypothetical protein